MGSCAQSLSPWAKYTIGKRAFPPFAFRKCPLLSFMGLLLKHSLSLSLIQHYIYGVGAVENIPHCLIVSFTNEARKVSLQVSVKPEESLVLTGMPSFCFLKQISLICIGSRGQIQYKYIVHYFKDVHLNRFLICFFYLSLRFFSFCVSVVLMCVRTWFCYDLDLQSRIQNGNTPRSLLVHTLKVISTKWN